jgi:hypothetical protein
MATSVVRSSSLIFGWARALPFKQKGEAHEALLLMFKWDGVPPEMILDGSKEQMKEHSCVNCKR